eukprot:6732826-Pyramimonas_sp.AAC.1
MFPRRRPTAALQVLRIVGEKCQPRVWAAVLRLWCHGWCTSTRFGGNGPCQFGCRAGQDSVRHLAFCPV